jgi:ubiquinone/menaquinone biosynthesis C-methylase UbiE
MSADFPECEFLGVDIAPLQPTTVLPKNCSFELTNVLEGIPKPDNYFDYIHQRFLIAAIPKAKWKQHIQECARICASDGWIEIIEPDGQFTNGGPACQQYNTWSTEGLKACGIDLDMVHRLDELMREVGLVNVTKQIFTVPIGPWGGKVGELFYEDYKILSSSVQPLFTSTLGVPKEEVERMRALLLEEFKSYSTYSTVYVYVGQKQ